MTHEARPSDSESCSCMVCEETFQTPCLHKEHMLDVHRIGIVKIDEQERTQKSTETTDVTSDVNHLRARVPSALGHDWKLLDGIDIVHVGVDGDNGRIPVSQSGQRKKTPRAQDPLAAKNQSSHTRSDLAAKNQSSHTQDPLAAKNQSSLTRSALAAKNQSSHTQSDVAARNQSSHTRSDVAAENQSSHTQSDVAAKIQSSHTQDLLAAKNQSSHTRSDVAAKNQSSHTQSALAAKIQSSHAQDPVAAKNQSSALFRKRHTEGSKRSCTSTITRVGENRAREKKISKEEYEKKMKDIIERCVRSAKQYMTDANLGGKKKRADYTTRTPPSPCRLEKVSIGSSQVPPSPLPHVTPSDRSPPDLPQSTQHTNNAFFVYTDCTKVRDGGLTPEQEPLNLSMPQTQSTCQSNQGNQRSEPALLPTTPHSANDKARGQSDAISPNGVQEASGLISTARNVDVEPCEQPSVAYSGQDLPSGSSRRNGYEQLKFFCDSCQRVYVTYMDLKNHICSKAGNRSKELVHFRGIDNKPNNGSTCSQDETTLWEHKKLDTQAPVSRLCDSPVHSFSAPWVTQSDIDVEPSDQPNVAFSDPDPLNALESSRVNGYKQFFVSCDSCQREYETYLDLNNHSCSHAGDRSTELVHSGGKLNNDDTSSDNKITLWDLRELADTRDPLSPFCDSPVDFLASEMTNQRDIVTVETSNAEEQSSFHKGEHSGSAPCSPEKNTLDTTQQDVMQESPTGFIRRSLGLEMKRATEDAEGDPVSKRRRRDSTDSGISEGLSPHTSHRSSTIPTQLEQRVTPAPTSPESLPKNDASLGEDSGLVISHVRSLHPEPVPNATVHHIPDNKSLLTSKDFEIVTSLLNHISLFTKIMRYPEAVLLSDHLGLPAGTVLTLFRVLLKRKVQTRTIDLRRVAICTWCKTSPLHGSGAGRSHLFSHIHIRNTLQICRTEVHARGGTNRHEPVAIPPNETQGTTGTEFDFGFSPAAVNGITDPRVTPSEPIPIPDRKPERQPIANGPHQYLPTSSSAHHTLPSCAKDTVSAEQRNMRSVEHVNQGDSSLLILQTRSDTVTSTSAISQ